MATRADAIANARQQLHSGAFLNELNRRVAYRTESQSSSSGAALRAYLVARGECWREDLSNADVSIPRNRIRRDLMPLLATISSTNFSRRSRSSISRPN